MERKESKRKKFELSTHYVQESKQEPANQVNLKLIIFLFLLHVFFSCCCRVLMNSNASFYALSFKTWIFFFFHFPSLIFFAKYGFRMRLFVNVMSRMMKILNTAEQFAFLMFLRKFFAEKQQCTLNTQNFLSFKLAPS